jgi:glycosylphosphatidylinositol transamidase (GPIT) subunit GPI8
MKALQQTITTMKANQEFVEKSELTISALEKQISQLKHKRNQSLAIIARCKSNALTDIGYLPKEDREQYLEQLK